MPGIKSLKHHSDTDAENIASKVFVRSTRAGKVQKIVREVYLRQDIPCSSKLCRTCRETAPTTANGTVVPFILSEHPDTTKLFPRPHYIIPDTNVFLNGMDLFDQSAELRDVIVLQTVLEELRNRSLPLYTRLVAMTKNIDKRFYVFFNDFHQETSVKRRPNETINDRNDRAVRRATSWYKSHLHKSLRINGEVESLDVIMITDDRENRQIAEKEGIASASLTKYISGLSNAERLLDMINSSRENDRAGRNQEKQVYPEYYSASRIATGIKDGSLHQGIFNVSQFNYLEGTVQSAAFKKPLLILGREQSNRAISGDVVVVEILPKDLWKAASQKIIEEESLNRDENAESEEGVGDIISTLQERQALQSDARKVHQENVEGRPQPTAKVVGVVKRNWRQYVGHVDVKSGSVGKDENRRQQTIFILPMDKRIPKIRLRTRQASTLVGQRILITIDGWDIDARYPSGHFVRSLGELESKGAETEALLLEYDVQFRPFPQTVLDCLPLEGHDWKVPSNLDDPRWKDRKDLRDLLICSIDPIGCQDIDDALHARLLPNGNYEVGVHIADVSHFVRPETAMDIEASQRGTTVYLVDKRIDMLPMLLGTNLCSLKPFVERFAFSAIWELRPDASIVNTSFTKTVIRSREAFSYEQAQLRIDDPAQQDDLTKSMRILLSLSKKLRAARMAAGALNLASPEVRIQTDSETSDPIDVKTKELLDTNQLVEEFMLLANISVARKIQDAYPQTALLRRHGAPPAVNFESLSHQLKVKRSLSIDVSSSKSLADSLDKCVDTSEPFFNTLIRIMATRCMMSAEYFCSGAHPYSEYRHYGLASDIYTHFTSPIRRYADLEAHRQLAAAIGYEDLNSSLTNKHKLEGVCRNINIRHRNAQMAGRASVEFYVGQSLKGKVVNEDSFIMIVFENGFVVFVPKFGIEGLIRLRDLTESLGVTSVTTAFDADEYCLTVSGEGISDIVLNLFDKVVVQIRDVKEESTGKRKVKMSLVV